MKFLPRIQHVLWILFVFLTPLSTSSATHNRWCHIKNLVVRSDLTEATALRRDLAEKALKWADEGLKAEPKNAECYYYRGQAKGILAEGKIFGYPTRVRSMLGDWKMALELDPSIDHGGPDRMV